MNSRASHQKTKIASEKEHNSYLKHGLTSARIAGTIILASVFMSSFLIIEQYVGRESL
jgi:hypothetical protein